MRPHMTYSVRPVWAGGSPAQVGARDALTVLLDELNGWQHAREGVYGPAVQARADADDLAGRAELLFIYDHHIEACDLITGRVTVRRDDRRGKARGTIKSHKPWATMTEGREPICTGDCRDDLRLTVTAGSGVRRRYLAGTRAS